MKIKVTEQRDCCDHKRDLLPYHGTKTREADVIVFCKHCGQLWREERYMDAAGSPDDRLAKVAVR